MTAAAPESAPIQPSPRLSLFVVVLLALAYALPGILGHDPWKPDEPYTFGVVLDMMSSGDWVVPTNGGQPFVEKPPLYFWLSWASASAFGTILPLHDAARLASFALVLASLAAIGGAARLCWGEGTGGIAVLLFLGAAGLEGHAQRMHVDLAMLAGFSLAMLGFAGCVRERGWGGAVLGLGAGIGFLGKGLFAPAVIGVTALLLPLFFAQWRTRRYALQLLVAFVVVAPALIVWPLALHMRSEELFGEWLNNNVGRFLGYYLPGAVSKKGTWSYALVWVLFPLWIYAAAAIAIERRPGWHRPGMQIGFTTALVAAGVLALSASMRDVYALPLIPPLALAAVAALRRPESVLERALGSVCVVLAMAIALVIWGVWVLLVVEGHVPEGLPLVRYLPAAFHMPVSIPALVAAFALTAGYIALAFMRRRLAAPGLSLWVGALALVWGLAHTLWLPWLDAAKSYRSVFAEIGKHLPPDTDCIVTTSVGESERAMIWYYLAVAPRSRAHRAGDCGALLWQTRRHKPRAGPTPDIWRLVWSGSRPADTSEGFALYVRRERAPFADNPPVR